MSAITLKTGCVGNTDTITIEWFDHNMIQYNTVLLIEIVGPDRERRLCIKAEGQPILERKGDTITFPSAKVPPGTYLLNGNLLRSVCQSSYKLAESLEAIRPAGGF